MTCWLPVCIYAIFIKRIMFVTAAVKTIDQCPAIGLSLRFHPFQKPNFSLYLDERERENVLSVYTADKFVYSIRIETRERERFDGISIRWTVQLAMTVPLLGCMRYQHEHYRYIDEELSIKSGSQSWKKLAGLLSK